MRPLPPLFAPVLIVAAATAQDLTTTVDAVLAEHSIPGAVIRIERHGKPLLELARGSARLGDPGTAMTPTRLFQIGSVTKPIVATLLGRLVDQGTVAFDDTIAKHLPTDSLPEALQDITLRELATHTSGLPRNPINRRDLPDSPSVMRPYSIEELHAGLLGTERAHPRGEWHYSNLGYAVLGHCLERAANKSLAKLLQAEIFGPLSMKESGVHPDAQATTRFAACYWWGDNSREVRDPWRFGEVFGFAGVYTSAADLSRFLQSHCAGDGGLLLSAGTRATLHEPLVAIGEGRRMATGWFVDAVPGMGSLLGHGGEVDGHSACVALLPKAGISIVILCNQGDRSAELMARAVLGKLPKLMRGPSKRR